MKIYFEDGKLVDTKRLPVRPDFIINAADGVSENINSLDNLLMNNRDCIIYTNSLLAFSNRYAWNENLRIPEIYIRDNEHGLFMNIVNFTNRELRECHNLAKMYVNVEFGNVNFDKEQEEEKE